MARSNEYSSYGSSIRNIVDQISEGNFIFDGKHDVYESGYELQSMNGISIF